MNRLATSLVAGLPGSGKQALLQGWLAARPAGERWALIVNGAGARGFVAGGQESDAAVFRPPGGHDVGTNEAAGAAGAFCEIVPVGGCACCTGSLAFEAALLRLLRRGPRDRLLVELDGGGDPARFVDWLRAGVAGRHLRLDEVAVTVDAGTAQTWLAQGGAIGNPRIDLIRDPGGRAGRLLAAQLAVADRVILQACDRLQTPQACHALAAALRSIPPFRRRVEFGSDDEARFPFGESASDLPPAEAGWLSRRWPAQACFDRADLEHRIAGWRKLPGLLHAQGAFRTERDWYLWQYAGGRDSWTATGWRRDNRIEARFDPACARQARSMLEISPSAVI